MDNPSTRFIRVELRKKRDKILPIIIGSILTIITFILFGWICALIVMILGIGFSISIHKTDCPKCSHKNDVANGVHNFTCKKCKSLILIDWID